MFVMSWTRLRILACLNTLVADHAYSYWWCYLEAYHKEVEKRFMALQLLPATSFSGLINKHSIITTYIYISGTGILSGSFAGADALLINAP